MPGTIHVSVLDFLDLPSTSSSSVLFKVSMGRREYQTLDKGDFSFQVKSLREKLSLEVLDGFGSKMCETAVEAILVVQKGQWDDYFSLGDGGRVHMRLQFVLSDEDRSKIRKMRETALRKKQRQLLITHPESVKTHMVDDGAINSDIAVGISRHCNDGNGAAKTGPVSASASFSTTQPSRRDQNDQDGTKEATNPSAASDSAEVNTRALFENQEADKQSVETSVGSLNFKQSSFTRKGKLFDTKTDDEDSTATKKGQKQRAPSSVKNMISAFESNTVQDTKSRNKPPPLKSPVLKLGFENPLHDMAADEVLVTATKKLTEMSSENAVSPSFFSELRQKVTAKKRQISFDVVEIITIAPERDLAEAAADELVDRALEGERFVPAVDDRFEVAPVDIVTDDIKVLEVETSDNIYIEEKKMQNDNMTCDECDIKVPEDENKISTVEKDKCNEMQGDLNVTYHKAPEDQARNMSEETVSSISAKNTHLETTDGNDPETDQAATVHGEYPQLVADDPHSENQNFGSRFIKVFSEKKVQSEDSQHVRMGIISTQKAEPIKSLAEWSPTCEPTSSWIFLDEPRVSCIVPSSIQLINPLGACNVNPNIHAGEHSIYDARKPLQEKRPVDEPSRSCSADDSGSGGGGNLNGQFAQAIKIAIMVAFGALVFFSRQRNHR